MSEKVDSSNVDNPTNGENVDNAAANSSAIQANDTVSEKAATTSLLSTKRIHTAESLHCLLLQDTTRNAAPDQLTALFSHFELKTLSKAEILFQLVYLVALESGFAEQLAYRQCVTQLCFGYSNISFFDAQNVLCLLQHKPTYSFDETNTKFRMTMESIIVKAVKDDDDAADSDSDSDSAATADSDHYNFVMSGIVTGDFMIVTLTPMCGESPAETHCIARSICLPIPRYVLSTAWRDKSKPLNQFLAKMDDFAYNLRENLFVPIQNEHLAMLGIELYPALLGIPGELYDYIFHCLSPNQLRILANVNKQLNQLVVNSKHYSREPAARNRLSFLSPSQSRVSFRY